MNQTICRYPLNVTTSTVLSVPQGARPLTATLDESGGVGTLWMAVDLDAPTELRKFYVVEESQPLNSVDPLHANYIGSFVDDGVVQLIFEEVEASP